MSTVRPSRSIIKLVLHGAVDDTSRVAVSGARKLSFDFRLGPLQGGRVEAVDHVTRVVVVPASELKDEQILQQHKYGKMNQAALTWHLYWSSVTLQRAKAG